MRGRYRAKRGEYNTRSRILRRNRAKIKVCGLLWGFLAIIVLVEFYFPNLAYSNTKTVYIDNKDSGTVVYADSADAAALEMPVGGSSSKEPVSQDAEPLKENVETLIRETFGEAADEAIAIAKCESNMQADRVGDKHLAWDDGRNGMSCGVMQIRVFPNRPNCEELQDPKTNIKYAKQLYDAAGWNPWTCARKLKIV